MRKRTYVRAVALVALAAVIVETLVSWAPHHETADALRTARQIVARFDPAFQADPLFFSPPPAVLNATTNEYEFGRYARPIPDTGLRPMATLQSITSDKAFAWIGLTQDNWHVSMALLQFNYAAAAVFSVFDSRSGRSWSLYRDLPGPLAPILGPVFEGDAEDRVSVASGCVSQRDWAGGASFCYNDDTGRVEIAVAETLSPDNPTLIQREDKFTAARERVRLELKASIDLRKGWFPTMVMPLGFARPVTVSKYAARPVESGNLLLETVDEFLITNRDLSGALASTDFTRGLLRRETVWHWLSLSAIVAGEPYGFHLSAGTYDFDANGASSESSIFGRTADGHPSFAFYGHKINVTAFDPHVPKTHTRWRITGPGLQLVFTPSGGVFHGSVHLGLVDCDLYHMWGTFAGTAPRPRRLVQPGDAPPVAGDATTVTLDDVPGVLEDHYSLW